MLKLCFALFLSISTLFGQATQIPGSGGGGGGTGNVSTSGTPTNLQSAQWTDGTHVKGVNQGEFNVRLMYGAVPDGSTDNSTAITNAFTASNAFTSGVPTVYFDCDTGTTVCVYNYGGSGTSPINPTVPTTILCAPGTTLNYTGSAHAADIGLSGLAQSQLTTDRYLVEGCRWTGGASYTAGLYFNNYIVNPQIVGNVFRNFGNRTGYTIIFTLGDWTPTVINNYWTDSDGGSRNMLYDQTGGALDLWFSGNKTECETASGLGCAVASEGVGLWIVTGWVYGNEIKYHRPLIRFASSNLNNGFHIVGNMFEGNFTETGSPFTYGDPGGTGNVHVPEIVFTDNHIFWPMNSGVSYFSPETASSGLYYLDNAYLENNHFDVTPTGGAPYVNSNGSCLKCYFSNNTGQGQIPITRSSSPSILDTNVAIQNSYFNAPTSAYPGNLNNAVAAYTSDGAYLTQGSYHHIAIPRKCADSSGSGTTQSCSTTPQFDIAGTSIAPVAGDEIIYKTTTPNSGALTVNVNATGAKTVKKNKGQNDLVAGDIPAGAYSVLLFDGTNWDLDGLPANMQSRLYTVATLPACNTAAEGLRAGATDLLTPTFLTAATGGGAVHGSVYCNGTAWVTD